MPWRAAEVYAELVEALRRGDHARALERAAVLGHYVGDAHVPLHAVLNYDGQLSGQEGVHARWESALVDRFLGRLEPEVRPGPATAGSDPVRLVFEALLESFLEARLVLASDAASVGGPDRPDTPQDDRYDDAYYARLYTREGPRARARLELAAARLGSLWLRAFLDAGRPALDAAFRIPFVRGQRRLVVASLDGAAAPLLDDAVRRGLMPNLAALRARGAVARGSVTTWPAKTAPGHATLFTGAGPDRHGITGNTVHLEGAPLSAPVSGYRSEALRAEPLWVTAARQGLTATMICSTQDYPFEPYEAGRRFGGDFHRRLTFLTGYKGPWLADVVYRAADLPRRPPGESWRAPAGSAEIELNAGESRVFGLLTDDPADPARGFDTLLLSIDKDASKAARLKPLPSPSLEGFVPLVVHHAGDDLTVHFRLFSMSPDGSDLLLYRTRAGQLLSNHPGLLPAATRETGGFVGNGASKLYEAGALGAPLYEGGDGTAEHRYLETVRHVERGFERLLEFGARRTSWDLLFGYLPFPDEFLHLWWGHLDPSLEGHDPALAARLRPFLDEGLRVADGYVGALARHTGKDVLFALGADHGMVGVRTRVRVNAALREAGLLALDDRGRIDPARTRAYYEEASGRLLLNRASREGGVVLPLEEAALGRRLRDLLRGLRAPSSSLPLVEVGEEAGGDLPFRVAPGVFATGETAGRAVYDGGPQGEHLQDLERADMHASFVLAGPGVLEGTDLGLIRQTDVAPTLAFLLGLEAPAQATGRVLGEALSRR